MEKKVLLSFAPELTFRSFVNDIIKNYNVNINIIKADIEIAKGGKLIVTLAGEESDVVAAEQFLTDNGVVISRMGSAIKFDQNRCVACGSCTSSCPSGALTITAPDWTLNFNPDKCIMCKMCLKSCPMKLFSIEFAE
ncbi:MAG: 4Fe-4S binding protein [Rikenellaceae bacterium]|jgi:ferredoxin|nr:4Fe-4S binding protein [Rikenellaceae bacterium]MBO7169224.1 4Fe-4S binding protein [Rikenellaceae bacterium]